MARRLREADEHPDARVVGWESKDGRYHTVYNDDDRKVGRAPSDRSLERAHRIVFRNEDEYFTVGSLTADYGLDDAIAEIEDYYSDAD